MKKRIKIQVKSTEAARRAMSSVGLPDGIAEKLLGRVFNTHAVVGGSVCIADDIEDGPLDGWWLTRDCYTILTRKKKPNNNNLMGSPRGNATSNNRNFGLNSSGKGDKPRTLFDERWRQRYDEIRWGGIDGRAGGPLTGIVRVGNKLIKHYQKIVATNNEP
jgi:hypothetical protein